MQVMNTTNGPVTIAGVYTIQPGSLRTFDAELWAELRVRKAVAFWLERGDLREIDNGIPVDLLADGEITATHLSAETLKAIIEDTTRDPLDHDGDGRKGGSKPRNKGKR
jgi:hypothetical protein